MNILKKSNRCVMLKTQESHLFKCDSCVFYNLKFNAYFFICGYIFTVDNARAVKHTL